VHITKLLSAITLSLSLSFPLSAMNQGQFPQAPKDKIYYAIVTENTSDMEDILTIDGSTLTPENFKWLFERIITNRCITELSAIKLLTCLFSCDQARTNISTGDILEAIVCAAKMNRSNVVNYLSSLSGKHKDADGN
jgi:hypothetical protein